MLLLLLLLLGEGIVEGGRRGGEGDEVDVDDGGDVRVATRVWVEQLRRRLALVVVGGLKCGRNSEVDVSDVRVSEAISPSPS